MNHFFTKLKSSSIWTWPPPHPTLHQGYLHFFHVYCPAAVATCWPSFCHVDRPPKHNTHVSSYPPRASWPGQTYDTQYCHPAARNSQLPIFYLNQTSGTCLLGGVGNWERAVAPRQVGPHPSRAHSSWYSEGFWGMPYKWRQRQ